MLSSMDGDDMYMCGGQLVFLDPDLVVARYIALRRIAYLMIA